MITPFGSLACISSDVGLYVLHVYRGQGSSVAILQRYIYHLRVRGFKQAISGYSLRASEKHAQKAYQRMGFFRLGEI